MKKAIWIILFCLMFSLAVAAPPVPYIIFGHVNWNDQLLSGTRLKLTNVNTGYINNIATNVDGYWQEDVGNWATPGQSVKIEAIDGCGTADTCSYTVVVGGASNPDFAVIDFSLTGTLVCAPVSCPSCGGGGSGGGSSGCTYTESKCAELYPPDTCQSCPPTQYSQSFCNELYPCASAPSTSFPTQQECPAQEECVVCPEQPSSPLSEIITGIIAFLFGGGGLYVWFGRSLRVKVIQKDGKEVVYHQHLTISGYHSPDVMHRKEPHKKGELLPKYKKDEDGNWKYIG